MSQAISAKTSFPGSAVAWLLFTIMLNSTRPRDDSFTRLPLDLNHAYTEPCENQPAKRGLTDAVHKHIFIVSFYENLRFDKDGLIPAIIQEQKTGRVVMMAWMNRASLEKTVETGQTHFWSRSRQKFWMKGETSGHTQKVKDIAFDCDGDTLLIQVEQNGAACHEGYHSCFFRSVDCDCKAFKITESRLHDPEAIYGKK
jgi:phosphoribosyl-AMP cyclohydrolase